MTDVRETIRQTGDLIGATVGEESLGGALDAILGPLADDVEAAHNAHG